MPKTLDPQMRPFNAPKATYAFNKERRTPVGAMWGDKKNQKKCATIPEPGRGEGGRLRG